MKQPLTEFPWKAFQELQALIPRRYSKIIDFPVARVDWCFFNVRWDSLASLVETDVADFEPITVVAYSGRYVVYDGNHRLLIARVRRSPTIPARLLIPVRHVLPELAGDQAGEIV